MTDQELIERLRMDHPDYLTKEAADRIEQLAATCEELVKERDYTEGTNDTLIALNQTLEAKLTECEARLGKVVEALRGWDTAYKTGRNEPLQIAAETTSTVLSALLNEDAEGMAELEGKG